jgi:CTP synthase (UTP-ammonia lyase)
MPKITILDHVKYNNETERPIVAEVNHDGCLIYIEERFSATVSWETMNDVEHLSEVMSNIMVCEFKVAVQLLGKVYALKDVYKSLV